MVATIAAKSDVVVEMAWTKRAQNAGQLSRAKRFRQAGGKLVLSHVFVL